MSATKQIDLVIIGGGSAGLAAAISAKEQGIENLLIIEKEAYLGGILEQCIHNGFGLQTFKEMLSGPEYAERFINIVKDMNIPYVLNSFVTEITKDKDVYYTSPEEGSVHIQAKAIIMATGCVERTAGQIQLAGKRLSGIYTAGLAQKYLNIEGYLVGKKVFILGSGDIGLIMARRMTLEGAQVLGVAELMPYSNGLQRNIAQCLNDFNIPLYLSHTVKNVFGEKHVEGIEICQVDEKMNYIEGTEKRFDVDTLILSVGLLPYNILLNGLDCPMSSTRGAQVNQDYMSGIDGIFECGNALHVHDLVDYVSEEAKEAGIGAAKYLKGLIKQCPKTDTKAGNGISYIVPQSYSYENLDSELVLKYRVRAPKKNVTLSLLLDGQIIKQQKKLAMVPSEMERWNIKKELLKEAKTLEIRMEEV